jgi:hypothetical protein
MARARASRKPSTPGGLRKREDTAMKTLLTALALVVGTVATGGLALARTDSPFYPDNFNNPNPPVQSVGAGSGIPWQYRLGK